MVPFIEQHTGPSASPLCFMNLTDGRPDWPFTKINCWYMLVGILM